MVRKKTVKPAAGKKPSNRQPTDKKPVAPKAAKPNLIRKYRAHKKDTGSIEVQIALFSEKISLLVKHLKKHHKDNDSKRGLLQMIGRRRRLLNYLKKKNEKKYEKLILDLGLRK